MLQESSCSLHIAQMTLRMYPSTRSIPLLTSASAPGVILASANVGQSLQHKTSVFLSADAGLSWHQVSAVQYSIGSTTGCTITEKAPTRAFSWLKAPTSAFTFKTLLRHYAKRVLTPRSLNVKLGPRRNYHKGTGGYKT